MGTNWKKSPLSNYSVHKVAEGEAGFNYYGYVHSARGQVIIMREEIAIKCYLYADGGFNLNQAWTDRASLAYKTINKI